MKKSRTLAYFRLIFPFLGKNRISLPELCVYQFFLILTKYNSTKFKEKTYELIPRNTSFRRTRRTDGQAWIYRTYLAKARSHKKPHSCQENCQ